VPVSNDDLAEAIQRVDKTLSEVLVLLFHVIHAHQDCAQPFRAEQLIVSASSRIAQLEKAKKGPGGRRPRSV
jgi:hypothetical protein